MALHLPRVAPRDTKGSASVLEDLVVLLREPDADHARPVDPVQVLAVLGHHIESTASVIKSDHMRPNRPIVTIGKNSDPLTLLFSEVGMVGEFAKLKCFHPGTLAALADPCQP